MHGDGKDISGISHAAESVTIISALRIVKRQSSIMPRLAKLWPRGTGVLRNRGRKRKEGEHGPRKKGQGWLPCRRRETHRIVRHVRRFYSRFHSTLHLETCQFASRTYRLIQGYVPLLGEILHLTQSEQKVTLRTKDLRLRTRGNTLFLTESFRCERERKKEFLHFLK